MNVGRHDTGRIEPEVFALQIDERSADERRADRDDKRERDLPGHKRVGDTSATGTSAGTWKNAYFKNGGVPFIADVCIYDGDPPPQKPRITKAYDFKFSCKDPSPKDPISKRQRKAYRTNTGRKVIPIAVNGAKC